MLSLLAAQVFCNCVVSANCHKPRPVLWLDPKGQILVSGKEAEATFDGHITRFDSPFGTTYDFGRGRSALRFADLPELRLSGSLTISVWIYPRRYHVTGNGSQILFRGDDRSGLDPYYLRVEKDGEVHFAITNAQNNTTQVMASLPLRQWTCVTASFDTSTGKMELWLNGKLRDQATTSVKPFVDLDPTSEPGVGVGNLPYTGTYNQPFDGLIADLRLYSAALDPRGSGFDPKKLKQVQPPLAMPLD